MIEKSNRQALKSRKSFNRLPNQGNASEWMQVVGTVLTQWMYPFTAWQANAMEEVWWRGVGYKVGDGGTVELIEKTDAVARLRGGGKQSSELLATGTAHDGGAKRAEASEIS